MSKVRVLIADDSLMAQGILRSVMESDPELEVVGTAADGGEAVALSSSLHPDVITMDINMPRMDGFQAIQKIMATNPTPILVVTSCREAGTAFRSLSYGALDIIEKPEIEADFQSASFDDFNRRIKTLSRVRTITHLAGKKKRVESGIAAPPVHWIVAIAASTGGPRALASMLENLPASLPASLLIVQHMPDGFTEGLVSWLQTITALRVKMAEHGETIVRGTAYIAPHGKHLVLEGGIRLELHPGGDDGHCPSGNRLFESLAKSAAQRTVGVVLTGMGRDGAVGLKALRISGGRTIVQDEASSLIFGMPKAALECGAADRASSLDSISGEILSLCRTGGSAV